MMNEKMLELYRQAQVPHTAIDPSNNMPYETTTFSAEKFAKLIVRECAGLVEGQPHFDKMLDCATVIEQHFGVEE